MNLINFRFVSGLVHRVGVQRYSLKPMSTSLYMRVVVFALYVFVSVSSQRMSTLCGNWFVSIVIVSLFSADSNVMHRLFGI